MHTSGAEAPPGAAEQVDPASQREGGLPERLGHARRWAAALHDMSVSMRPQLVSRNVRPGARIAFRDDGHRRTEPLQPFLIAGVERVKARVANVQDADRTRPF